MPYFLNEFTNIVCYNSYRETITEGGSSMYKEMVFEDLLSEIASSNMSADGGTVAALVGTLAAS